MSTLHSTIQTAAAAAIQSAFDLTVDPSILTVQETRRDFEGDLTLVVFPLTRYKLGAPHQIAEKLGERLVADLDIVQSYNVVKGFLNLSLSDAFWTQFLLDYAGKDDFFQLDHGKGESVVVEYCSPNTNKPLHLGHLRNIVLGYSLSQILQANGYKVAQVCLFNDRGTNISKSMYAYQQSGKMDTPQALGVKGDKLVGDYYVAFAKQLEVEVGELIEKGNDKDTAVKLAPSQKAINEMTVKWEAGDPVVRSLWEKMNGWVYEAYEDTFKKLGIEFEHFFYESKVYQRGKETVESGLKKGVFYTTEDGAVEIDLSDEGLDKKTMLRSNGTSLYITQDLAIAEDKFQMYNMSRSIYVVGNEQEYHFQILFKVLEKLEVPYAKGLYHLSYGMVDLPSGKMKSREGTTVEVDDLLAELEHNAEAETRKNLAKVADLSEEELKSLFKILGTGAVKYFLAKVDPKKRMMFNPEESVALKGNTGPYIQYAYARIQSIRRNAAHVPNFTADMQLEIPLLEVERVLLHQISQYPGVLKEAGEKYNPSLIANFAYELTKEFNRFYQEAPILKSEHKNTSAFRLALATFTGETLKAAMSLLGIGMPSRM